MSTKLKWAMKSTPESTSIFRLYKPFSYSFAYPNETQHNTTATAEEGTVASSPSGCSPCRCEANVVTAVVGDEEDGRVRHWTHAKWMGGRRGKEVETKVEPIHI